MKTILQRITALAAAACIFPLVIPHAAGALDTPKTEATRPLSADTAETDTAETDAPLQTMEEVPRQIVTITFDVDGTETEETYYLFGSDHIIELWDPSSQLADWRRTFQYWQADDYTCYYTELDVNDFDFSYELEIRLEAIFAVMTVDYTEPPATTNTETTTTKAETTTAEDDEPVYRVNARLIDPYTGKDTVKELELKPDQIYEIPESSSSRFRYYADENGERVDYIEYQYDNRDAKPDTITLHAIYDPLYRVNVLTNIMVGDRCIDSYSDYYEIWEGDTVDRYPHLSYSSYNVGEFLGWVDDDGNKVGSLTFVEDNLYGKPDENLDEIYNRETTYHTENNYDAPNGSSDYPCRNNDHTGNHFRTGNDYPSSLSITGNDHHRRNDRHHNGQLRGYNFHDRNYNHYRHHNRQQ